jgi:transposase-like protein
VAQANGSAAEAVKIKRLKKELALVQQERDILKKAVSITSTSLSTDFSRPNE